MGQTLILVRHAQARHGSTRDELRPLTKSGQVQAQQLALRVKDYMAGGMVVHSPAVRAVQTAQAVARESGAQLLQLNELYCADEYDLLRSISALTSPVMVVGHAPTIPYAAMLIAAGQDVDLILKRGCPTATAYVFEVADMTRLQPTSAILKDLIVTPVQ
ncbi:histidine phosphatase family protein [uncultured Actinomyces sp.]|uniref:SixA phosphatase family protein n=1 Tax=uncultured Actinomyces sp. TaxID=249061 RepID=UPI00262AC1EC|nr:phosphoglycerate mutase family protein [uncultured Actinomyces sp.]